MLACVPLLAIALGGSAAGLRARALHPRASLGASLAPPPDVLLTLADAAGQAAQQADSSWVPALPALPALPDLSALQPDERQAVDSVLAHLATVAIDWVVPAVIFGLTAAAVRGGKREDDEEMAELLRQLIGRRSEPKELIKVDVLDNKLASYAYSFTKASVSKPEALRRKQLAELTRKFGELGELDGEQLKALRRADDRLRARTYKTGRRVARLLPMLRQIAVDTGGVAGTLDMIDGLDEMAAEEEGAEGEAEAAEGAHAGAEEAGGAHAGADEAEGALDAERARAASRGGGGGGSGGGGLNPLAAMLNPKAKQMAELEVELSRLSVEAVQHELDYVAEVSAALTSTQRRKLKAALAPAPGALRERGPLSRARNGNGALPSWVDGTLDALSPLYSAQRRAAQLSGLGYAPPDGAAPDAAAPAPLPAPASVYVLTFDGDVQANQVGALREEVTAVIRQAQPGDEVVLKLNSGGGTVTGYGLAAAQLERLKSAGLTLTVCVDQVAASGGYMMACVASEGRLFASPFAVLGSIGVISEQPNVYRRLKDEGITFLTVTAGKFKRTLTPFKKPTKADFDKQREDIGQILDLFKAFVQRNRPQLEIEEVATGETWFGQDALERKLCDALVTSDDVILQLKDAGAERVYAIRYEPTGGAGVLTRLLDGEGEARGLLGGALGGGAAGGGGGLGGWAWRRLVRAAGRELALAAANDPSVLAELSAEAAAGASPLARPGAAGFPAASLAARREAAYLAKAPDEPPFLL